MIIEEQTASSYIQYTKLQLQIPKYKQITSDFQIQQQPKYLYIHPLVQLHYVGKFSFFYYKNDKYFIGTEEGKIFIRDNNKEKQIEIVQQQEGIVFSLLNKVTPFKSTLKKQAQKSLFQALSLSFYNKNKNQVYNNAIVSICLSEDDKLLLVGIKQGEVHVYHYSSMTKLDVLQFLQPQVFLQFYFQSQEGGLLSTIETTMHKSYEMILSDVQGNVSKICFDIFKLINQRTIKYEHFLLINFDNLEQKDQNQVIYDMKILEKRKLNIRLIIMWNTKIDLLMIKIGKTDEIEIISSINRNNLKSFYDFYNANNENNQIIQSCFRNQVSFGCGKMRIYNKEKNLFEEFKQNWVLCYYGPQIIIADKNLKPIKFGIISVQKFENQKQNLEISFISFISENIILIQLENHQSILVNLDEFGFDYESFSQLMKNSETQNRNLELQKFVYKGVQLNQLQNIDFRHRIYIKEDNQNPYNLLYIDDCCRASKCILYTWQSYLNVLYDKKEFIVGLQECYQLLNKKNKVLQNIPLDNIDIQINQFIKRFAKGFCENIKLFDNQEVEKQIIYVLELLLTTNNGDIIFTDLRDLLKFQNKVSILYKYSEEYQIEQVPFKVLLELEQELKPQTFQKLLKGLDPKKVEYQNILPYLQERKEFELLIYFAINSLDFITPVKIMLNQQVVVNFILMILQGQSIIHEKLLVQNHRIGVITIINYIFNNYFILLKLLDQDQEIKIGLMCFHHKVMKVIQQLSHEIQIQVPPNLQSLSQLRSVENNFEKIYALITQSYELKLEQSFPKENIKFLNFFQSESILTRMISIKKEFHLKLIKYFILNYDEYKIQNKNLFFLNHFHMYFQNYIHLNDVIQIKQLLNNDLKENTISECYLLDLTGQYQQCLEKWLLLKNKQLKQQIFSWIQSVLQRKLEIYFHQDKITQYYKQLMEIDPKETYEIVNQYYKDMQSLLINSITDEKLALSYIQYMDCILADHILLNEQTKLRFVKYLCQFQKKEVKKYIQQDYFPLKESLTICLEFHNYGACEIIYFKLGEIKQVVELMSQKLVLRIKQCTRTILKTKQFGDQDKAKVLNKLDKIKVFIKKNGGEYKDMNNLWLLTLDRFFKENPIKNLTAKSLPPLLKGQLQQVTFYILYQMLLSMNFFDFVQIITIKYPEMSSSIFSRILFAIKDLVYQQSQFYFYGQVLHYEEKAKFLQKIKSFVEKGIKVQKLDCECVEEDKLCVIYKCGHSFHLSCLPNNISRCCLCQNQVKDQIMRIPNQRIVINQRQQFEYKTKEYQRKMDKIRKFENHKLLDQMQQFSCWDIK